MIDIKMWLFLALSLNFSSGLKSIFFNKNEAFSPFPHAVVGKIQIKFQG